MVYLQQFTHAKPQPKQIFTGEKRKHVINRVIDALNDYRVSRFENEASIRTMVRSSLCLQGNGWRPSDDEAAGLLIAAFTQMGVKRPSWMEGQNEWTESEQNCSWCKVGLAEAAINRGDRYCGAECAKFALKLRDYESERYHTPAGVAAYKIIQRAKTAPRTCEHCQATFHTTRDASEQRFCSGTCRAAASRTVVNRPCAWCGVLYRPKLKTTTTCSHACKALYRVANTRIVVTCESCAVSFIAKSPKARACGRKCRKRLTKLKTIAASEFQTQSQAEPSSEVQMLATVLRHPALSVEAFDALFHPPREPTLAEQLAKSFGGARAFAMEGEFVRELRVRFIQEGMSWADAQAEAERTVEEAIQIAGLERPRSTIAGGYRLTRDRKAMR